MVLALSNVVRLAPPRAFPALLGRALLGAVSTGGPRGLSILIYHRVLAEPDPLFPGEIGHAEFEQQIGLLKGIFNVISLADAVRHVREGTLPPRAACITFDDGYADNAEIAMPILQRHGVTATFFIATGFLNGGRMWNDSIIEAVRRAPGPMIDAASVGLGALAVNTLADRKSAITSLISALKYVPLAERVDQVNFLTRQLGVALPTNMMMTTEQVRSLRLGGMDIGAHTVNHPILARIDDDTARREIAEGKMALEQMIGERVGLFAYPNGKPRTDYLPAHVAMARELGFDGAVSTAWGGGPIVADPYQLPRFTPWDRDRLRFTLRLARNLTARADRV